MLGVNIKGLRHLQRVADTPKEFVFNFANRGYDYFYGWALSFTRENGKKALILVNEPFANQLIDGVSSVDKKTRAFLNEISEKTNIKGCTIIDGGHAFTMIGNVISNIVLLNDDFSSKLASFEAENKKALSSFDEDFKNSATYKFLFSLTDGNKNIFLWAIRQLYKHGVSIHCLKTIINLCSLYPNIVSKLSKGSITAYNGSQTDILIKELLALRREARKNTIASTFNTKQKKILKEKHFSDAEHEIFYKFSKLSGKKKVNFIKKVSTIENPDEIISQMSHLVDVHFVWSKESFMHYLSTNESINCKIALEKGDIVIVEVKDYETIKRLAKTTNWCISKNKTYWNQYIEDRSNAVQFVMFDFSKKEDSNLSIVGFTVGEGFRITNAHDFQNHNLFFGFNSTQNILNLINSFVPQKINNKEIYSILGSNGITLSDLVEIPNERYEWNRESFLRYFWECIDEDDYVVIADHDDKIAMVVDGPGVSDLFGDFYLARIGRRNEKFEHVIFADFSKPSKSHDKLSFGICMLNDETGDVEVEHLYNDLCEIMGQTFDSKLEEYGLPYDIVCRGNNLFQRFIKAFSIYDFSLCNDLIKFDKVKKELKEKNSTNIIHTVLYHSFFEYYTMDGINVFYDNGISLCSVLNNTEVVNLVNGIIQGLNGASGEIRLKSVIPSASDIEAFNKKEITNRSLCIYIGLYLILMKMIEHENSKIIHGMIAKCIMSANVKNELFDYLLIDCGEALKGDKAAITQIFSYAKNHNRRDVIDSVYSVISKS